MEAWSRKACHLGKIPNQPSKCLGSARYATATTPGLLPDCAPVHPNVPVFDRSYEYPHFLFANVIFKFVVVVVVVFYLFTGTSTMPRRYLPLEPCHDCF